jgi:hypothetical protein
VTLKQQTDKKNGKSEELGNVSIVPHSRSSRDKINNENTGLPKMYTLLPPSRNLVVPLQVL